MKPQYVLAVDQSTSGTKALLIDKSGRLVAKQAIAHMQSYPQPGWVEHDPLEIYGNVVRSIREVLRTSGTMPAQLAAITITNQRETVVVWDAATGMPVYPAIVWQCRRTADICERLKAQGAETMIRAKTGLVLDPYFSATKIRWILDRLGADRAAELSGRLLAGTIDSWVVWKLTGGAVHATDFTNASRTSLFNIHSLQWDAELIELFGVQTVTLPEVRPSSAIFGHTMDPGLFEECIPISGIIGDSQAALFGQRCWRPGMAKATYGTGTSVLLHIGHAPIHASNGIVTTIAWMLGDRAEYALEGIIHTTGDCLRWVRDQLGLFKDYAEAERMAASLPDNEGVYLVPALVGMGAPYWNPYARAAILNLSRRSDKRHIIRAALESIAYQVRDTLEWMAAESGVAISELHVDGGAAVNRFLMQFQADLLQTDVTIPSDTELSAFGSAMLGGLGAGFWSDKEELGTLMNESRRCRPGMKKTLSDKYYHGWKQAVHTIMAQP